MADDNGRADARDEDAELPPGLSAWFAIEECVGETLNALTALGDDADQAHAFVSGIHRAVKAWLSWELWAALLDPTTRPTVCSSPCWTAAWACTSCRGPPATSPRPGQAGEWRAFEGDESRG
jgi:hypothetical protein